MSTLDNQSTNHQLRCEQSRSLTPGCLDHICTTRLEAFSDGVFAIVITLLVLEIRVPEIPEMLVATELPHKLLEMWPKFLSYVTSFLVIGVYWVAHHNVFHYVKRSDRILPWLNILSLMCISFIPFPTALIGEYGTRVAVALYGGTLTVNALAFNLMWWYISKNYRLLDKDLNPRVVRTVTRDYVAGIFPYLLAFLISFFSPIVSTVLYFVIPVVYIVLNSRHIINN